MDELMKPSIAVKVGAHGPPGLTGRGPLADLPVRGQPYPPKLHVQPRILLPLMLLPRENLPLACIDFTAIDRDQPRSRFYESHVKILDLESRLGSAPSVLIARREPTGTVYALERQGNGLYVMCQLGPWVDLSSLSTKATALSHQRLRPANPERKWQDTAGALTTPGIHKEQKKKRAAIEAIQSLVRKRVRSVSVPAVEVAASRDGVADSDATRGQLRPSATKLEQQTGPELAAITPSAGAVHNDDAAAAFSLQDTADTIFNNIRTQYFDALYRSLVGIARMTCGPSLTASRDRWHTSPRDPWRVPALPFISTSSPIWTWPT